MLALLLGTRLSGIGLGVMGGLGLAFLVFVFGLIPTSPPINVMFMITAVIAAASAVQAAGGLDYMVYWAEKLLRSHPKYLIILSPIISFIFTVFAGTGYVAYSFLPVISEVAIDYKIRPERPMAISVIASQHAISASPISAATVALLGLLSPYGYSLGDILKVSVPAIFVAVIIASIFSLKQGKDLNENSECLKKISDNFIDKNRAKPINPNLKSFNSKFSVAIFLTATFLVILYGSFPELRPKVLVEGVSQSLKMPLIIEIVMLSASAIVLLITKKKGDEAASGSIFSAGMQAVVAIFGVAWMGDTFIKGNLSEISSSLQGVVTQMPWLFCIALFFMSVLLYSKAVTVVTVMPLGLALHIDPLLMIAFYPAVNGYFFLPNNPAIVTAMNFDRTGTTRVGKYLLNHSFMQPGMIVTVVSVLLSYLLINIYW